MANTILGITLWIAILTVSVSVGANVFQMMVVDPQWSSSPPQSVEDFAAHTSFAPRMQRFHTNPVYVIGLLCILASVVLGWETPVRNWAFASLILYLVVVIGTLSYVWRLNDVIFVRGGSGVDPNVVIQTVHAWLLADRIRLAFKVASFVCLLRALMLYAKTS